jgi:hypothetical protein
MAVLVPLNTFKSLTKTVTNADVIAYTAPIGVSTVVLLSQFVNITSTSGSVSANIVKSGVSTELIKDFAIPGNDAGTILTGRLVLEEGDQIVVRASDLNKFKFIFSYLETANA